MKILFVILCIVLGAAVSQCSVKPDNKPIQVEVDRDVIKEEVGKEVDKGKDQIKNKCGGFNPGSIRNQECSAGEVGVIVEFCREDGTWQKISGECKKECDSDKLKLDQSLVTFDKDIKPLMDEYCIACHGTMNKYEVASDQADEIIRYVSLADSDDDCMPKDSCSDFGNDKVELLLEWQKNGLPENGNCAIESSFIDLDQQESAVLEYLAGDRVDSRSLKFMRFFSFAHKINAGESLKDSYVAFNQAINALSFDNEVFQCSALPNVSESICALDIRSIDRTTRDFRIIENFNKFKVKSNTQKGVIISQLVETDTPIIHFDAFIESVFSNNNVYTELMNLPLNFVDFLAQFNINFVTAINDIDYHAIGTNSSDISAVKNTRLITRFDGTKNGVDVPCWVTFDNGPNSRLDTTRDLFISPFLDVNRSNKIFNFDAQEVICTLPNKASMIFALYAGGIRQDFAPTDIVFCNEPFCVDPQIDNPVDCMGCHANGYLPKVDVVGPHVLSSGDFNAVERELAEVVYGNEILNPALFNKDNLEIAKGQSKLNRVVGDKREFAYSYKTLRDNQSLNQVASFLFISEQELSACINRSNVLKNNIGVLLSGGKINHDTLIQNFKIIIDECRLFQDPIL